jgi:hypothetical protein
MTHSTTKSKPAQELAIEIPAHGLYPLFGKSKSQTNALSPIYNLPPSEYADKIEKLDKIINHPQFDTIKKLLLKPDVRIEHRYGGSSTGLTVFSAFTTSNMTNTLVAFPDKQGTMLLRLYPTFEAYIEWWTTLLLSRVDNAVANFLPPPLTVPSAIYAMHSIDCYRRYAYKMALSYQPATNPFIPCLEFNQSLSQSIQSFDLDWLLSSFFALTPDLEALPFEPVTADLENLVRRTILQPAKSETAESLFYFGEGGQYLGAEFLRSWELSIGISARQIIDDKVQSFYRAFIAPTALSNHLFQIESADNQLTINHQNLTLSNIQTILKQQLGHPTRTKQIGPAVESKKKSLSSEAKGEKGGKATNDQTNTAADQHCTACGKSSPSSMKFCGNCGNKLDEATGETARRAEVSTKSNQAIQQLTAKEFQALAAKIQHARDSQRISEKQFKTLHTEFKAKTPDGALWTVGLKSQEWFKNIDGAWQKHKAPDTVLIDKELIDKLQKLN